MCSRKENGTTINQRNESGTEIVADPVLLMGGGMAARMAQEIACNQCPESLACFAIDVRSACVLCNNLLVSEVVLRG